MENLDNLLVVFTVYVIAAGSPDPSTLRIMGVASVTIFGGCALVFLTAPMIRRYRSARRWIEAVLAAFFGFARRHLLMSRV